MGVVFDDDFTQAVSDGVDINTLTPVIAGDGYTEVFDDGAEIFKIIVAPDYMRPGGFISDGGQAYSCDPAPTEADVDGTVLFLDINSSDNDAIFILLRYTDRANNYGLQWTGTGDVTIFKNIADTQTILGTEATDIPSNGDTVRFSVRGTTLKYELDSGSVGSFVTHIEVTDSAISAAGKAIIGCGKPNDDSQYSGWDVAKESHISTIKFEEFGGTAAGPVYPHPIRRLQHNLVR